MATLDEDTIAAVATAPGRGGIGIVRLSGQQAYAIAEKITRKKIPVRTAINCGFYSDDGTLLDRGIAIYFAAPGSFTGEDIVELQSHGSPIILDQILGAILRLGARQARPGEFSQRAFLNNKLDLAQAEAIADLIAAGTEAAANAALHSLQGAFSKEVNHLVEKLVSLRMHIEAALDFPDEELDLVGDKQISAGLIDIKTQLKKIFAEAQQGVLLAEGLSVVIIGRPNAGKSSLLNALAGKDAAIVTPIAGTTRDTLHERIQIDGMPLHIIDTAGLHESADIIEQEGMRRAQQEIARADRILLVVDASEKTGDVCWPAHITPPPKSTPISIIQNKCDLSGEAPGINGNTIILSAKTGSGLPLLRQHLKELAGLNNEYTGRFSARRRHLDALEKSRTCIENACAILVSEKNTELLAEELRLAQLSLEEITGRFTPDDLLGKIFSDFCIGK